MGVTGAEVVFDWPVPPARDIGLATETYLDLDPYLPADDVPYRWLNGVTWTPWGCMDAGAVRVDNECDNVDLIFPDPVAFDAFATIKPFRIQLALACSVLGGFGVNGEELQKRAMEITRLDRSRLLARQVMFGTPETTNFDLSDQATGADIVTTTDTTPIGALAAVESALAQRLNNAQGMIHVSPGMLTYLASGGGFGQAGGKWITPSGNIVVADAGYTGAGGQAGQEWIYGSGLVYFAETPLMRLSSTWENFDWATERDNIAEVQVEQYMIAVFEPCTAVAARTDFSLSPVGI